MYVESDFILALLKEDDWLQENAEKIYEDEDRLWTSRYTLIELMVVSYREGWDCVNMVANTARLVDVEGDTEEIKAAASYIEEEGFTPFDALHLVASGEDRIVSSEKDYDGYSRRKPLEEQE